MGTGTLWYEMWYYAHDHLYSPVFLAGYTGVPVERYEYDAYGNCQIMDAYYNPRATSNYANPFTHSRFLSADSLLIGYSIPPGPTYS